MASDREIRQIQGDSRHFHRSVAMAYREYIDFERVFWRVWEVIPQASERRRLRDRRIAERGREQSAERRRRHEPRLALSNGDARGWLVFESAAEKRRLQPIPVGWFETPEYELATLCERATLAGRPSRRLIE
jgi:hypothetical protein